jgi:hypothetical protein
MASEQADEFIESLPQGVEAKARVSYAGETTSIDLECDGWKIFTDELSRPALFASDKLFFQPAQPKGDWEVVLIL